jgi:hypothetical protein
MKHHLSIALLCAAVLKTSLAVTAQAQDVLTTHRLSAGLAAEAVSEAVAGQRLGANASAGGLAKLPHVLLTPGAVVIRSGGEAIAAIGVGGAPGGDLDEACAKAGLDKIGARLK